MKINQKDFLHVGLLAAMPEELGSIIDNLKYVESVKFGDLEIFSGEWINANNKKILISVAWSGWGKVSSARAATRLISNFYQNKKVEIVIFTGVAGAVDKKLNQWDIVISDSIIQHDMDARPIFKKFVIPAINKEKIFPNAELVNSLLNALVENLKKTELSEFGKIYKGLIGTGDMFISDKEKITQLSKEIPNLLAIEMEGAAFAQVAHQENIDWIVMRVISDGADDNAVDEFSSFLEKYQLKSWELIKFILNTF